jgi:hypothetical protein
VTDTDQTRRTRQRGPLPGLALVLASFGLNGVLYGSLLSRYAEIANHVRASSTAFGAVLAVAALGGLAGSLVAPLLVRATRDIVAVTVFGCAFAVLAIGEATAPTLGSLAVLLFVMTMVDGGQDVSMNGLAVGVQQRAGLSVVGRAHATWSFSLSVGTAIGAGAAWLGVPVPVHVGVVAVVAIGAQLGAWWRARDLRDAPTTPRVGSGDGLRGVSALCGRAGVALLVFGVAAFAASYVESPGQEWTALLLNRGFHATPGLAAAGPLVFSVGLLTSRLVLDPLTTKVRRSTIARVAGVTVAVSMLAGLLLSKSAGTAGHALAVIAIAGAGAGPVFPLLFGGAEILSRRHSIAPATTTSVVSALSRAGAITAPAVVGVVTDVSSLSMVFAVIAVGGAGVAVALPRALRAGRVSSPRGRRVRSGGSPGSGPTRPA